jgi:adenylosuccinate synthase
MSRAIIVVGLGFGDEGKGSMVDYLCRQQEKAALVVRFNGGSQAAHNVITPDGRHHTFAQFGSGSFLPTVQTYLSRFMLLDPFALANEARGLIKLGCTDPFQRLSVDSEAKVITPFQKAANRLREALRSRRHGSCGMGIGETMADSLASPPLSVIAAHLRQPQRLIRELRDIQEVKYQEFKQRFHELTREDHIALQGEIEVLSDRDAPRRIAEAMMAIADKIHLSNPEHFKKLAARHPLIFEGAQGVLLDEWYGFHPYTTWSTTTTSNALSLLSEIDYQEPVERLGLLRAYHTRHGAGPFPTADPSLSQFINEEHNGHGPWQGEFRFGHFDTVLARYALEVCEVDSIALTNLDRLEGKEKKLGLSYRTPGGLIERLKVKAALTDLDYQEKLSRLIERSIPNYQTTGSERSFIELIESRCNVTVSTISRGPTALDKRRIISSSRSARRPGISAFQ